MSSESDQRQSCLLFRPHPADEDDQCKSVVRIGEKHMQQLGLKEGDVVQIEGNTKSTAAVCLALDETKSYVTNSSNVRIYDVEIEYKSSSNTSQSSSPVIATPDPYPKIRGKPSGRLASGFKGRSNWPAKGKQIQGQSRFVISK